MASSIGEKEEKKGNKTIVPAYLTGKKKKNLFENLQR